MCLLFSILLTQILVTNHYVPQCSQLYRSLSLSPQATKPATANVNFIQLQVSRNSHLLHFRPQHHPRLARSSGRLSPTSCPQQPQLWTHPRLLWVLSNQVFKISKIQHCTNFLGKLIAWLPWPTWWPSTELPIVNLFPVLRYRGSMQTNEWQIMGNDHFPRTPGQALRMLLTSLLLGHSAG